MKAGTFVAITPTATQREKHSRQTVWAMTDWVCELFTQSFFYLVSYTISKSITQQAVLVTAGCSTDYIFKLISKA